MENAVAVGTVRTKSMPASPSRRRYCASVRSRPPEPDEPAYFLPSLDADDMTSARLGVEDLDGLASGQRVLADLFLARAPSPDACLA